MAARFVEHNAHNAQYVRYARCACTAARPHRWKQIDGLPRAWLARLPHLFTPKDRAAGYHYDMSILQAAFALTQVLDRPVTGRVLVEEVIWENLDRGRPSQVHSSTIVAIIGYERLGNHPILAISAHVAGVDHDAGAAVFGGADDAAIFELVEQARGAAVANREAAL